MRFSYLLNCTGKQIQGQCPFWRFYEYLKVFDSETLLERERREWTNVANFKRLFRVIRKICVIRVKNLTIENARRQDRMEPQTDKRCIKGEYDLCRESRLDESTLVQRAANGDAAAWEPLALAHQQAVFRLAYLLLGDADDAEDIAQETFLRAWKALKRFDSTRPLRPWLLSIAANLSRNRRRSAGRYVSALMRAFRDEPKAIALEEKSSQHTEANELWRAVQQLDLPDQQIVYLRYFLDLPVSETADVLQIAEGTVKSRLSRALEKLRKIIHQDFPVLFEGREA